MVVRINWFQERRYIAICIANIVLCAALLAYWLILLTSSLEGEFSQKNTDYFEVLNETSESIDVRIAVLEGNVRADSSCRLVPTSSVGWPRRLRSLDPISVDAGALTGFRSLPERNLVALVSSDGGKTRRVFRFDGTKAVVQDGADSAEVDPAKFVVSVWKANAARSIDDIGLVIVASVFSFVAVLGAVLCPVGIGGAGRDSTSSVRWLHLLRVFNAVLAFGAPIWLVLRVLIVMMES